MFDERFGGKKAYCASRNILRPVSTTSQEAFAQRGYIIGDADPVKVSRYNTQWLGTCLKTVYEF